MKLINKMLDNYCTDKLKDQISSVIVSYCILDFKFENSKVCGDDGVRLYIKRPEHKENFYCQIYCWRKRSSFYRLINFEEMIKTIRSSIDSYVEGNK